MTTAIIGTGWIGSVIARQLTLAQARLQPLRRLRSRAHRVAAPGIMKR